MISIQRPKVCSCCWKILPLPPPDVVAALDALSEADRVEVVSIVAHGGSAWINDSGCLVVAAPVEIDS